MHCIEAQDQELSISLNDQTLSFNGKVYSISSSKFGVGVETGSNKTPLGRFQVSEKFGTGEAPYTIFKARKPIGLWVEDKKDIQEDKILSRILRLSGLDSDNHNTFSRYIYIHGTNDENGIGDTHSIGCIRMKNIDIIALYNCVALGSVVQIY